MKTTIISIRATALGSLTASKVSNDYLDELNIDLDLDSADAAQIQQAAQKLRISDIPIAFPTETVYGLGADATRSDAVRGIYTAKQRPSDNPLIVHFASLNQIRRVLYGKRTPSPEVEDPIPPIYHSLIERHWPGPLTILLRNPEDSVLAPEVTAGLSTFGARIPRHPIALSLIQLADVPVAAPSANASTKPSPTAAEHVAHDLDGRIETVIDGGPCEVGVESTVVDGLSSPPAILRPGGISLEQIRRCPGWEDVSIGYMDVSEKDSKPRAPGMKYRHYSPKARVILAASGASAPSSDALASYATSNGTLGVIRTISWQFGCNGIVCSEKAKSTTSGVAHPTAGGFAGMLQDVHTATEARQIHRRHIDHHGKHISVLDIDLGNDLSNIARGIFGALRDLDRENVDAIIVEGVDDSGDDLAAAVMNRLKKAAEVTL